MKWPQDKIKMTAGMGNHALNFPMWKKYDKD